MCGQKFVKMGCISSKKIDRTYPNVFKVINVDDSGNQVGSGLLEIKNFELVLYQKGKSPIMWPLKTLRRYGFDADHFSFESGRRCLTGPGIYAFRCQRAEQLFNLIQSRIQVRELDGNYNSENSMNFRNVPSNRNSLSLGDTSRRVTPNRFSSQFGTGRLSSIGSTSGSLGPISPISTTSAPIIMDTSLPSINLPDVPQNDPEFPRVSLPTSQHYQNEEVIAATRSQNIENIENIADNLYEERKEPVSPLSEHSYANSFIGPANAIKTASWKKSGGEIKIVLVEEDEESPEEPVQKVPPSPEVDTSRLYMNMPPATEPVTPEVEPEPVAESEDITNKTNQPQIDVFDYKCESGGGSLYRISENPPLPTSPRAVKSLNYIVLDLEQTGDPPKSPISPNPSESGKRFSGGYTSIDFQKTVALSHSIHPDSDLDRDSCRKTRHSSNAFPHERHGSSVSD